MKQYMYYMNDKIRLAQEKQSKEFDKEITKLIDNIAKENIVENKILIIKEYLTEYSKKCRMGYYLWE